MKKLLALLLGVACGLADAPSRQTELYKTGTGPHRVHEARVMWHDGSRDRGYPR